MKKTSIKKRFTGEGGVIENALANMNYRDLKVACILRGATFEEIAEGDHGTLSGFFTRNYYIKPDKELLYAYDKQMDKFLRHERGYKKSHPLRQFKLASVLEENEEGEKVFKENKKGLKKAGVKKPVQMKKERDSRFNVFTGTKKALTYDLAAKDSSTGYDYTPKEIVILVMKQFPEATEKSIKIWVSRARKLQKEKGEKLKAERRGNNPPLPSPVVPVKKKKAPEPEPEPVIIPKKKKKIIPEPEPEVIVRKKKKKKKLVPADEKKVIKNKTR